MKTSRSYGKRADRALRMWVKLIRATTTFGKLTEEHIRTFGMTEPQFSVFECLGHLGPLTLGELSRKQLVSGGNITCVIDNLEGEGLVERTRNPDDRRTIVARLTPKGEKMFGEIFHLHAAHVARLASVLTEQEQDDLSALLKKLGLGLRPPVTHHRLKTKKG